MAYQVALNSQVGDQQYLRLDVPFDLFTTPTYYLEIDIQVFENGIHILSDGLNINVLEIGVNSINRTTRLKRGSINTYWYRTGLPDTNDFYKFGFEKIDDETYELFVDDVSLGQRVNAKLDDASILFDTIAKSYHSYFKTNLRSIKYYDQRGGELLRHYDPSVSVGVGYLVEKVSGAHAYPEGITNFDDVLEYYDDGTTPSPTIREFTGSAAAIATAQGTQNKFSLLSGNAASVAAVNGTFKKVVEFAGNTHINADLNGSATKVNPFSGGASVDAQSVSLFEKLNTFNGAASVITTSQSSASKLVPFNGQATVSVTASASIINGNFEISSFSGGALITASASGQVLKVGLVSGQSTAHASASGQVSKVAHVDGNATVTTSTQSAFSKIANAFGEAISRITASSIAAKRVVVSGASTVVATVYGQFFNTESNVETYQTIVQGRVKANLEIKSTGKSTTIQGRVK